MGTLGMSVEMKSYFFTEKILFFILVQFHEPYLESHQIVVE
ncbi:hypothetical protein AsAng_0063830 (plasmid) [Aureispira anguillae]|uniref:Uncharacterized protein n=1 Tax=Aureispira anguillae TaxID=2864201 RepID=A0A915YLV0_9BACT|nr:hypothetical protein AsAng_0063830 [Aureispira anguillae]